MSEFCCMCCNARVCPDLSDDSDFSSISVGKSLEGVRVSINAGYSRPVCIEVELYDSKNRQNFIAATYYPNFCPNCGRSLTSDY